MLAVGLSPHFVNGIPEHVVEVYKLRERLISLKLKIWPILLQRIQALPLNDIVIISDTDIFWAGHNISQKMIEIYNSHYNGKLVVSAESNCWNGLGLKLNQAKQWLVDKFTLPIDYDPYDGRAQWFQHWLFCYHPLAPKPSISTENKFLNYGFLIGSVRIWISVLKDFLQFLEDLDGVNFCTQGDQCLWQAFSINESRITLNYKSEFVLSGHGNSFKKDFFVEGANFVYNPANGLKSKPFGVHTNGLSKGLYAVLKRKFIRRFGVVSKENDSFYFDGIKMTFSETCKSDTRA